LNWSPARGSPTDPCAAGLRCADGLLSVTSHSVSRTRLIAAEGQAGIDSTPAALASSRAASEPGAGWGAPQPLSRRQAGSLAGAWQSWRSCRPLAFAAVQGDAMEIGRSYAYRRSAARTCRCSRSRCWTRWAGKARSRSASKTVHIPASRSTSTLGRSSVPGASARVCFATSSGPLGLRSTRRSCTTRPSARQQVPYSKAPESPAPTSRHHYGYGRGRAATDPRPRWSGHAASGPPLPRLQGPPRRGASTSGHHGHGRQGLCRS